jgi:hypothetical protein
MFGNELKVPADRAPNEMAPGLRQCDSHFVKFGEKADWNIYENWLERFFEHRV